MIEFSYAFAHFSLIKSERSYEALALWEIINSFNFSASAILLYYSKSLVERSYNLIQLIFTLYYAFFNSSSIFSFRFLKKSSISLKLWSIFKEISLRCKVSFFKGGYLNKKDVVSLNKSLILNNSLIWRFYYYAHIKQSKLLSEFSFKDKISSGWEGWILHFRLKALC